MRSFKKCMKLVVGVLVIAIVVKLLFYNYNFGLALTVCVTFLTSPNPWYCSDLISTLLEMSSLATVPVAREILKLCLSAQHCLAVLFISG